MTHANPTRPARRVLMIAANPATSPTTGWPIGFWWAELSHPFLAFEEAGYDIDLRSPDGGAILADALSDPEDASGYSAHDVLSRGFKHSPAHMARLQDTASLAGVDPDDYDAVFVVGGQSPMVTMVEHAGLHALLARFLEAGRVTALVCHATCALLRARGADGELLVKGRTWTGFADSEEAYADSVVGQRIQPFWIEQEARKLPDTHFVVDQAFRPFAVRDGLLITGQQQNSGAAAARLVIEALGR